MAAAVPVAAILPVVITPKRPERFVRVCIRHTALVQESMVEAGRCHIEVMGCPGNERDSPHRVYAWGVYDLFRGRVLAIGSEKRIILLEGFDVPKNLEQELVEDVPSYVKATDAAGERSTSPWVRAMSKLPPAAPRSTRRIPIPGRRLVSNLRSKELEAIKVAAWAPGADQAIIATDHGLSVTDVLKIKHGMVGH